MAPGLSGVKTRGRGCDRRTEQIVNCWCKRRAKHAWKYVLRYQGEGLSACHTLCNSFPKQCRELALGAPSKGVKGILRIHPSQQRLCHSTSVRRLHLPPAPRPALSRNRKHAIGSGGTPWGSAIQLLAFERTGAQLGGSIPLH